jgi:hypothetical protein
MMKGNLQKYTILGLQGNFCIPLEALISSFGFYEDYSAGARA